MYKSNGVATAWTIYENEICKFIHKAKRPSDRDDMNALQEGEDQEKVSTCLCACCRNFVDRTLILNEILRKYKNKNEKKEEKKPI